VIKGQYEKRIFLRSAVREAGASQLKPPDLSVGSDDVGCCEQMCSSYASLDRQRRAKRPPLTPVCHNLRPLATAYQPYLRTNSYPSPGLKTGGCRRFAHSLSRRTSLPSEFFNDPAHWGSSDISRFYSDLFLSAKLTSLPKYSNAISELWWVSLNPQQSWWCRNAAFCG
jgi:hypothetical protein